MPVTQAQLDALNEAIATGELKVHHGDKSMEYRSIAELIQAREQLLRQQLAERGMGGPLSRITRLVHGGRGFDQ